VNAAVTEQVAGIWSALQDQERLALHATVYTWPAAQIPAGWLLDLGCEYRIGSLLIAETNPKLHVMAMDLDLPALRYPRGAPKDARIASINADARELPLASESVGGIYLVNLLNLVEEPERILSEVWRVLRPGGVAIMAIPADSAREQDSPVSGSAARLTSRIHSLFAEVDYPDAICGSIPTFASRSFRVNQPNKPWIAYCRKDDILEEAHAS
jgi:SAM-dependent methyltransferase